MIVALNSTVSTNFRQVWATLRGIPKISSGIQFVDFDFATAKCFVEWEAPTFCVCNPKLARIIFL